MSTLRSRLVGFAALVVILAILVGLPAVLLGVGANPFPGGLPTWSDLLRPDDGTLALSAIKVIAWVAWVALAVALLVEIVARMQGVRAPRLPGLPQGAARGLVGAAVALFAAAGPVSAATAGPAAPVAAAAPRSEVVATATLTGGATPVVPAAAAFVAPSVPTTTYTVRQHDSLWSIAERYLGDGRRYTELVDLNADLLGGKADFLQAGWVLTIPAPPAAPTPDVRTVVVRAGDTLSSIAAASLGDGERWPEILEASRGTVQPDGERLTDPDVIRPGWVLTIPGEAPAAARASDGSDGSDGTEASMSGEPFSVEDEPAPPGSGPPAEPARGEVLPSASPTGPAPASSDPEPAGGGDADEVEDEMADLGEEPRWRVATATGVGTILAASTVTVVARRRRNQQRVRRSGETALLPEGAAAATEEELRAAADERSVQVIDNALRSLATSCAAVGQPLPPVRAARLTADSFELFLDPAATLPAPWVGADDGEVWTLDTRTLTLQTDPDMTLPTPYPAFVTIGNDGEGGHILLNLEHLGALGIVGTPEDARAIAAALAVELAFSPWADDLQVTVAGWFSELEGALSSGRVRFVPTVERLLDRLAERADDDRRALAEAGVPDLNAARPTLVAAEAWVPEILLVTDFMTDDQKARLAALTAGEPRAAVAAVTAGVSVGDWTLTVAPGGATATIDPIGLPIRPQRLDPVVYDHVLDVVSRTDRYELTGDPAPEPAVTVVEATATAIEPDDVDGSEPTGEAALMPTAPRILLLGPVDVVGARGDVEDSKRARLVELAAYLSLHPNASPASIDNAIWPDRPTEGNVNTRNTATTKLRRWFGVDDHGEEYLPRYRAGGGYGFAPTVRSDVDEWTALLGGRPLDATPENLHAALALVRGVPFEGTNHRRYAWAEPARQRLVAEIVDAAATLAKHHIAAGRWLAADAAAAVGLHVNRAQEELWRLRIIAAHGSGNGAAEADAIERMLTFIDDLEADLEPETHALLAELRRSSTDRGQSVDLHTT